MGTRENGSGFTRVNLYEQIADYLEKQILLSGEEGWQAGDRLPAEQELADRFGVSRNVIRETIKVLKERGLVDPRNGVGATITRPDAQKLSSMIYRYVLLQEMDPEEIYDVRGLLEVQSAQLAAQRVSEEGLARMRELLNRMNDRTLSIKERRETDFEFHVEIARQTGNRMLEMLVDALREVFMAMMEKGIVVFGGIDDAAVRHERILEALSRHDSVLAGEMMREHIEYSRLQVRRYEEHVSGAGASGDA